MPAVIFVVSSGYGGYGDFLFALKLISSLQQKYQDNGIIMPVYLVTQEEGRQTIKSLKGDTEFNTEIITPDELKLKIDQKELTLNAVLEGPVFDSTLMDEVNVALVHLGKKFLILCYLSMAITHKNCVMKSNIVKNIEKNLLPFYTLIPFIQDLIKTVMKPVLYLVLN